MRKVISFAVTDDGRDNGKRFRITEMPAAQAEEWAMRALFTLMNCGVEVPDDLLNSGFAGIAAIGIKSLSRVPFDLAKPLFEEMMTCVEFDFEPGKDGGARALIPTDIEEVATRVKLRKVIFELHLNAFLGAAPSKQASGAAAAADA